MKAALWLTLALALLVVATSRQADTQIDDDPNRPCNGHTQPNCPKHEDEAEGNEATASQEQPSADKQDTQKPVEPRPSVGRLLQRTRNVRKDPRASQVIARSGFLARLCPPIGGPGCPNAAFTQRAGIRQQPIRSGDKRPQKISANSFFIPYRQWPNNGGQTRTIYPDQGSKSRALKQTTKAKDKAKAAKHKDEQPREQLMLQ
ncbi:unnamed protein product [Vitrella brassicaformis CCMP3155]|uniref:Uncharacterized protein n=2 Tax=Vitrella brassicaformis TaxID=1169539 RepID=A0A0G4EQB2_VITBC|nr:unnamed protein product [Vitrella brassicaformis CCMP3155]|eukprot:CEL99646.1 unnamed protein product [Vitrella brassicaformis CCMP3155]